MTSVRVEVFISLEENIPLKTVKIYLHINEQIEITP
jgi:hypothetical protein